MKYSSPMWNFVPFYYFPNKRTFIIEVMSAITHN